MASPEDAELAKTQQQLAALKKVDAQWEALQKEGKLLEALGCMEKSLLLRGSIYGADSPEVHKACKAIGEMCNYLAMTYLQQDNLNIALELLKKAEAVTERHKAVRAVTFNNLGCYYRKRGKLRTAQGYLEKALAIEARLPHNTHKADTHLNMCAVLSELGEHTKALQHARAALRLMKEELFGSSDTAVSQEQKEEGAEEKEQQAAAEKKLPVDRVAVLAIAYHNLAVQHEFLRHYKEALTAYNRAVEVLEKHGGESHPLLKSLTEARDDAQKKLKELAEKQRQQAGRWTSRRGRSPSPAATSRSVLADEGNAAGDDEI